MSQSNLNLLLPVKDDSDEGLNESERKALETRFLYFKNSLILKSSKRRKKEESNQRGKKVSKKGG